MTNQKTYKRQRSIVDYYTILLNQYHKNNSKELRDRMNKLQEVYNIQISGNALSISEGNSIHGFHLKRVKYFNSNTESNLIKAFDYE